MVPPWTVTREQWHSMSRPSVSGIAIDTFLFSRIGAPLFHRYRVFDKIGSHLAFRKPYMPKLFLFLRKSDSETIRRDHRRRAKEIATGMTRQASVTMNVVSETTMSGPAPQRTVVSTLTGRSAGKSLVPASRRYNRVGRRSYTRPFEGRRHSSSPNGLIIASVRKI